MLSFDSAVLERQASLEVVGDTSALVGLDKTGELTAGSEGPLVSVTDNANKSVTVTLTLEQSNLGELSDGTEKGETLSFGLDSGNTQDVTIDLNCEASVDDTIDYRTEVTTPNLRGDLNRTATVADSVCNPRELVFVATGGLASVSNSKSVTEYGPTDPAVVGLRSTDLDGDGTPEVPFSNGTELKHTDKSGDLQSLSVNIKSGFAIFAGEFNGSPPSVFYTKANTNDVFRVAEGDAKPVRLTETGGDTGIVGVGDVRGDSREELVLTSGADTIAYKSPGESVVRTKIQDLNGKDQAGNPADLDDDGLDEVPFVDGSGNLQIAHVEDETTTTIELSSSAKGAPVASIDYDGDGTPEPAFVDDSSGNLKYVDNLDGTQVIQVTDENGNPIESGSPGVGVA